MAQKKRARKQPPQGPYDHILIPSLSDKTCGFRLRYDWVKGMDIVDILRDRERELLVEIRTIGRPCGCLT